MIALICRIEALRWEQRHLLGWLAANLNLYIYESGPTDETGKERLVLDLGGPVSFASGGEPA